jgi:hypothetical protein
MGEPTLNKAKRTTRLAHDRVGDVIETGVMKYFLIRQAMKALSFDLNSVIYFNTKAKVVWERQ